MDNQTLCKKLQRLSWKSLRGQQTWLAFALTRAVVLFCAFVAGQAIGYWWGRGPALRTLCTAGPVAVVCVILWIRDCWHRARVFPRKVWECARHCWLTQLADAPPAVAAAILAKLLPSLGYHDFSPLPTQADQPVGWLTQTATPVYHLPALPDEELPRFALPKTGLWVTTGRFAPSVHTYAKISMQAPLLLEGQALAQAAVKAYLICISPAVLPLLDPPRPASAHWLAPTRVRALLWTGALLFLCAPFYRFSTLSMVLGAAAWGWALLCYFHGRRDKKETSALSGGVA